MDQAEIGSPAHRYAIKFAIDVPSSKPTNKNIKQTLAGCALPPPAWLYPAIRDHVYRILPNLKD